MMRVNTKSMRRNKYCYFCRKHLDSDNSDNSVRLINSLQVAAQFIQFSRALSGAIKAFGKNLAIMST